MSSELDVPSSGRPDLDEFFLTLGGFLEQKASPRHPNNLRFLSMFCRSIGASEGHILQLNAQGELTSQASVGLGKEFDDDFNSSHSLNGSDGSPLDEAFNKKEVLAIVDLKKETSLPKWFLDLMEKYKIQSVVAVPLLGQENSVGILCAYYHDVCLFDQNTLGHLTMVGRMIGTSMERQGGDGRSSMEGPASRLIDGFLSEITSQSLSKNEIFAVLAKTMGEALMTGGVVAGPIREEQGKIFLKIAGSFGLPGKEFNQVYLLPEFLEEKLKSAHFEEDSGVSNSSQWGSWKHLIDGSVKYFACPLSFRKKRLGLLMGWVPVQKRLPEEIPLLARRLGKISAIGLNFF